VSIARNNVKTDIHLQTSKNLNRAKQDVLLVHAQHYCVSNGKMKMNKIVNENMMNDLIWVKRYSFLNDSMTFFCYQNPN
jgi:hypothetical protein